jgi:hypothetical protein
MNRESILRRRIKLLTWLFIIGLVLSGATAIPLPGELNLLANFCGSNGEASELARWLLRDRDALSQTQERHPFLFYGTDWLAFGHFIIAIAFIGALRDPVRNRWLFDFGLIACVLVAPYALVFGGWLLALPASRALLCRNGDRARSFREFRPQISPRNVRIGL